MSRCRSTSAALASARSGSSSSSPPPSASCSSSEACADGGSSCGGGERLGVTWSVNQAVKTSSYRSRSSGLEQRVARPAQYVARWSSRPTTATAARNDCDRSIVTGTPAARRARLKPSSSSSGWFLAPVRTGLMRGPRGSASAASGFVGCSCGVPGEARAQRAVSWGAHAGSPGKRERSERFRGVLMWSASGPGPGGRAGRPRGTSPPHRGSRRRWRRRAPSHRAAAGRGPSRGSPRRPAA